ncbi:MAG: helix-turn-helix transcriptional regulator [Clostridia bacterium]|nr:helix-turn-helix transcriptional regulator [Clostridia bacterium]
MTNHVYEYHLDVRKNKLCPFKLNIVSNYSIYSCNWHENIEIIYVVDGSGKIRYGNMELDFTAGDIIVVNSGELHRLYSDKDMKYYYLLVDESFCTENGITTANQVFTPKFSSEKSRTLYQRVIYEYSEYEKASSWLRVARLRVAVLELLIDLCENHVEQENSDNSVNCEKYIKKAIGYIEQHYNRAVTLEELAKICGITKHHLSREFKRYTGQTVMTHLNKTRCKNAEVCLDEGMSVTETALECGFESVSYFSRTYKKLMGVLPSAHKKRINVR